ncbi:30037_t:CDS:1, partial [Gigaspora margarita]
EDGMVLVSTRVVLVVGQVEHLYDMIFGMEFINVVEHLDDLV